MRDNSSDDTRTTNGGELVRLRKYGSLPLPTHLYLGTHANFRAPPTLARVRINMEVPVRTNDIKERVASVEDEVGDVLRELHRILRAFGDTAEQVRESMARAVDTAGPVQDSVVATKSAIEDTVQRHPWTSLLIAFLAGAIASAVVRR